GAVARLGTTRFRQPSGVGEIAFTPDGNQIISSGGHNIRVWDAATGQELREVHVTNLMGLAVSPVGPLLATAQNGNVSVWDLGTLETKFSHETSGFAVAISPDGSLLASGGRSGSVTLWNAQTGE